MMKELYISPELTFLCLTPKEKLMDDEIDFDEMLKGSGDSVVSQPDDLDIPLPLI